MLFLSIDQYCALRLQGLLSYFMLYFSFEVYLRNVIVDSKPSKIQICGGKRNISF